MRRLLLAVPLLWAMPALAQTDADVAVLVQAIVDGGCLVTEANEAEILAASGLDEETAGMVVMLLMSSGQAMPEGDNLRLTVAACE